MSAPANPLHRREFLRWLAASPLVAGSAMANVGAEGTDLITEPGAALNVFDFERVARSRLTAAHFAYLSTGVDDEVTLRANREGFARLGIRVRRLVDLRQVETSRKLFGASWPFPNALLTP